MAIRTYSIRLVLQLTFTVLFLASALVITYMVYSDLQQSMRSDLTTRLNDILKIGASKVDVATHALLQSEEQEKTEEYAKVKETLKVLRDSSTGIRFVYTMRRDANGKYSFVVDAEENPYEISHIGEVYDTLNLEYVFDAPGDIVIDSNFTQDKWGVWLSGFAKLMDEQGNLEAILGMDISAASIVERERSMLLQVSSVVIVISLFFMLLGNWMAHRITQPLASLEVSMQKIRKLHLDAEPTRFSIFKEIHSIRLAEESMKKGLRSFKKYVSAELVDQLIFQDDEAELGGEKREMTVFFSDVVEFTKISEEMDPEDLADFMKDYFAGITSIILKYQGTVDKYIGDSVMAFWGAPIELEKHAEMAVRATLECRLFIRGLNEELERTGNPKLLTKFGLNTGLMVVGNFGYEQRLNYTVFGDNVNLANRLEDLNGTYGTEILISGSTYDLVKDLVKARMLDFVTVKGKKIPVVIYEVLSLKDEANNNIDELIRLYEAGLAKMNERAYEDAVALFNQVVALYPDDKPSKIMVQRCMQFMQHPPNNGVSISI